MWITSRIILALAPMADMTDSPFCRVCREVAGDKFVIFREMVSAEAIARDNAKTLKMCEFDKIERPIVIQIFGADPVVIRKAARIIVDKFHPDGIDVNMGCPVPKIAGAKGMAGAALMKNPENAVKIVQELKKEKLGVPVSVKTRLGWNRQEEILNFAPLLEQAGADAITIHGRTKIQGYSGNVNWEMIGKVKKLLNIPIIANGDVKSLRDIKKCLEITVADGVMIGRGALGNPYIFQPPSQHSDASLNDLISVVLRHAELHIARYGDRGMVTFRKHLAWYFKANKIETAMVRNIKEFRSKLVMVDSIEQLKDLLSDISASMSPATVQEIQVPPVR